MKNVPINDKQFADLKRWADATGLSIQEVLRQALNQWKNGSPHIDK